MVLMNSTNCNLADPVQGTKQVENVPAGSSKGTQVASNMFQVTMCTVMLVFPVERGSLDLCPDVVSRMDAFERSRLFGKSCFASCRLCLAPRTGATSRMRSWAHFNFALVRKARGRCSQGGQKYIGLARATAWSRATSTLRFSLRFTPPSRANLHPDQGLLRGVMSLTLLSIAAFPSTGSVASCGFPVAVGPTKPENRGRLSAESQHSKHACLV